LHESWPGCSQQHALRNHQSQSIAGLPRRIVREPSADRPE
jgi:hypothetical protein